MAYGDVSISDVRYFGWDAPVASGSTQMYVDASAALQAFNGRIMYEVIDSDYVFGEEGKKSEVSTHYTWKADVRMRVDSATMLDSDDKAVAASAAGAVAAALAEGLRPPVGSGLGKFAIQFGEFGDVAALGNPIYTGQATVSDISILKSDSDTPATERMIAFEMKGSGDLASATS